MGKFVVWKLMLTHIFPILQIIIFFFIRKRPASKIGTLLKSLEAG